MNPPARYIVTRSRPSEGTPIPEDEPCFVIRGQDAFAVRAVQAYIDLTFDIVHRDVTNELIKHRERIGAWQENHPPKLPDVPQVVRVR